MLLAEVTLSVNQAKVEPTSIEMQITKESKLASNAFLVDFVFNFFSSFGLLKPKILREFRSYYWPLRSKMEFRPKFFVQYVQIKPISPPDGQNDQIRGETSFFLRFYAYIIALFFKISSIFVSKYIIFICAVILRGVVSPLNLMLRYNTRLIFLTFLIVISI